MAKEWRFQMLATLGEVMIMEQKPSTYGMENTKCERKNIKFVCSQLSAELKLEQFFNTLEKYYYDGISKLSHMNIKPRLDSNIFHSKNDLK